MEKTAFIWDLDGTLLDSYGTIVSVAQQVMEENGIDVSREQIYGHTMASSLLDFFETMAAQYGGTARAYNDRYKLLHMDVDDEIPPMKHAMEVLEGAKQRGILQLVYTHKDRTAHTVLARMGILPYFQEVLTAESGFPRKPDPAAIHYFLEAYGLKKENTWYIGDRKLDMESACNAGIRRILFRPTDLAPTTGKEDFIVKDLLEILDLI